MTKIVIPDDRDPAYLLECARAQADQLRRDLNATRETCAMWERRAREPHLHAQAGQGEPQTAMQRLEEELHLMKTAGIIEVAIRNPSVSDYMHHWEGRTQKAELHAQATETALQLATAKLESYAAETRYTRPLLLVLALTAIAGWAV